MEEKRTAGDKRSFVRIAYAADRSQAEQMREALEEAGLEVRIQGGVRDVYSMDTPIGEEIMVPAEQAAEAGQVLQSFRPDASAVFPAEDGRKNIWKSILVTVAAVVILAGLLIPMVSMLNR